MTSKWPTFVVLDWGKQAIRGQPRGKGMESRDSLTSPPARSILGCWADAEEGGTRTTPMGIFHVTCEIENHARRTRKAMVRKLLVDTGNECTWIPEKTLKSIGVKPEKRDSQFVMANGKTITRNVGFAILRIGEHLTIDEVVFAQPGDLCILGARTLEGMNLRVDSRAKKLVAGGPMPAA